MKRWLLNAITLLSILLTLAVGLAWLSQGIDGGHYCLGMGRGRHTFDVQSGVDGIQLKITRYATPLTQAHPAAPFFRTQGYGWFVGDTTRYELRLGRVVYFKDVAEYGGRPMVFMTNWLVQFPHWVGLVITATVPTVRLVKRLRRHRQIGTRPLPGSTQSTSSR